MFLMQRNCGKILKEGKVGTNVLIEADRKNLITHTHAYLAQKCSSIERKDLILAAKTLVSIVPCLKDTTEGEHAGFVSVII